jgi:hypothetical protein
MSKRIGDAPIEPQFLATMNATAAGLDKIFNGDAKGDDRKVGFVLLVFPFEGREGRANYISNADRADVLTLLKEQVARFEGQPELEGRA